MNMEVGQNNIYLTLLQLEKEARGADTIEALGYVFANRLRELVPIRQAVVFNMATRTGPRMQTISDVVMPDANAPMVRWLQSIARELTKKEKGEHFHMVDLEAWESSKRKEALHWLPPHILWCPFVAPEGHISGAVLIAKDEAFQEVQLKALQALMESWAYVWNAQLGVRGRRKRWPLNRMLQLGTLVAILAQFIPVTQTTLAPAEVVARDPVLVAAPMEGVIETVHVEPNSKIKTGDILFSLDDTQLTGRLGVAEEELMVARAALRTAQQGAFRDAKRNAEVASLETRVALRKAERDFINQQVNLKDVYADQDGVAVFRDTASLEGRPVSTGERVMLIAKPYDTKIQIELPVGDAIVLKTGAPVRLFLNRDPLHPVDAVLAYTGYEAELSSSGVLSYRLIADFSGGSLPRIGLRGMAKVEGEQVALFLYLFRRPLSTLRQWIGL